MLERLELRAATAPRPWTHATLPRARALVLAAEGKLMAAQDELDAASEIVGSPGAGESALLPPGPDHHF